jgi:hypothetical protein
MIEDAEVTEKVWLRRRKYASFLNRVRKLRVFTRKLEICSPYER